MSSSRRKTVDVFIKNYRADQDLPPAARAAKFLYDLSQRYPKDYCNKRLLIKIAYGLHETPRENNGMMARLSYIVSRSDQILAQEHHRYVVSDLVEGYRATVDDEDTANVKWRASLRRAAAAVRRTDNIAQNIDSSKLRGELKKEFADGAGVVRRLNGALAGLPLLAPPEPKKDPERGRQ